MTEYSTLTFVQVGSHALVITANQGIVLSEGKQSFQYRPDVGKTPYLVEASPVHSKKGQKPSRSFASVRKLQQCQRFVLITAILRPFLGRIR
jgi:hypothetical protein